MSDTPRYEPPNVTEYGKFEEITKQDGKGSPPGDPGNNRKNPGGQH